MTSHDRALEIAIFIESQWPGTADELRTYIEQQSKADGRLAGVEAFVADLKRRMDQFELLREQRNRAWLKLRELGIEVMP